MRVREVIFYKQYFWEFYKAQRKHVQRKIVWTLDIIEMLPRVPEIYLKHIENTRGLYEIRVQSGGDIFRIFCFFHKTNAVVIANGFQKKTRKTPHNEIEKALTIKQEYEQEAT